MSELLILVKSKKEKTVLNIVNYEFNNVTGMVREEQCCIS